MIIKKQVSTNKSITIDIPISYEYDSNSSSIVLLDGYKYEIFYRNFKTTDTIDLTKEEINE